MKIGDRVRVGEIEGTIERVETTSHGVYYWLTDTVYRGSYRAGCPAPRPYPVEKNWRIQRVKN